MATTYISKIKQIGGNEEYVIKDAEAREQIATKAPLASPALTGTPTAPTAAAGTNTTQIATTAFVTSALTGVSSPMRFIGSLGTGGTATSLPAASATNQGYTYKVITANTYQGVAAKVGDMLVSDGSSWILIPSGDEPSGTVTSVGVSNATNGGLSISGSPVTTSGTISIGHSNVLSSAQTTQAVYPIKIDKNGHISAYGNAVSIPSKTSDLTNDSGFVNTTGAAAAAPVQSVNGQTGAVTIAESDEKLKTTALGDSSAYVLLGPADTTAGNKYYTTGMSFASRSDEYTARLTIGKSGTDTNRRSGQLALYNQDKYCILRNNSTTNSGYYVNLPASGGTLALTSEVQTWNGVSLVKQRVTNTGDSTYVPLATSLTPINMSFTPVKKTPTANAIAKYDNSSYLYSTTPSDNDNSTKVATTAFVATAIENLPEPMVFKGSLGIGGIITTLPAASSSNTGFTYKVITDGTYASQAAKVGDTFISDGTAWVLIPSGDEPSGTVTSVGTGVGLTGGSITSSGTIKAKLRSETALTNDSAAATETSGRVYPVAVDKSGYLAVNVPWTNINSSYLTSHQTVTNKGATLSWGATSTIATIGSTDIKVTMPANPNTNTDTLVKQTAKTDDVEYKILTTTSASPSNGSAAEAAYSTDFKINPNTKILTAPHFLASHTSGGQNEYRVTYGDTVDMALMIGTGNINHGLYDSKASKWMIYADDSGNVTVNGNATTATKATQDESGNNIKASYASSFSISGHTITLKNKNGDSLGTITVPDNNDNNKVTQAYSTTNANYPLLLTATAGVSSTSSRGDTTSILNNTIYGNPNKGMLYSKGLTVSSGTDLTLYSNTIRLRNLNNDNNQAGTNPWITSLNLGDNKYVTLTEYKDDHVALRGSSILLTTETAYEVYNPTSSYTVGKVVWYNKAYYRCTTAIPEGGEAWDSTHWASMPTANVMVNSHLVPWYTNDKTLGTSSYRWKAAYIGTANTYGSSSQPIYWNAGVPTAIDYTIAKSVPADAKFTDTTYGIATNTTNGLVKPWYTHTAASTGPTTGNNATAVTVNAISTTAGKYYAVEADKNGRLFVNVPWTNVNDSYVTSSGVTSITLSSGTGISVSDSGTAITSTGSRTISLASINGLTTGTYGPTGSNTILTPSHEGTFIVPTFSVDTYGRITSASNYTVKLPSDADTKVKQTVSSTNANYKLLFTTTASPTSGTAYETYYDSAITVNPSTDTITATTFVGKMSKGITIGNKTYNGSSDIIINSSDLGLTSPMTFKGVSITNLSDGATTSPITLKSGSSLTPSEGDVVLDSTDNEEYIWSGNKWNAMGIASSYAMAQHTHGNIANDGSLGSDVTIANGDKIVVTDASDSNKISRASISFDGSTTTKALSQKGTWESFLPISGGTLTGNVTLDKMTGSSANYGDELPATGTEGQIFFKVGGVESKVDSFYPVGSIYMSVSSANPGTLFGGTWERIEDTFLLAAGSSFAAGATGGAATHHHSTANHTLTVSEMPSHTHGVQGWRYGHNQKYDNTCMAYERLTSDAASTYTPILNAGGGGAHNHGNTGDTSNMPPYLAVYMWKRIA